jgi:ATPase subunit of ABC transporter with duplicated ATPase domains
VADLDWQAPVGALSGGQRRRVQLAELLIGDWDVIALDEPTNHLDVEGITWLAAHLKQRWARMSGGLLVVTHDRWFLDEVATTTWEVHGVGSDRSNLGSVVEPFDGGYAAYVLQRVERDRVAAATEVKRQNLKLKELAWLRRGAPARTSKPKFRIDAANALIADVPPVRDTVELAKLATYRLGKDVIDLLDVSVSYPGIDGAEVPVLRDVEWRIAPGERTGIVGANGAGKSTLLGLIAGTITPDSGMVKRGKTVRLAMLDQQAGELVGVGLAVVGGDLVAAADVEDRGVRVVEAAGPAAYVGGDEVLAPRLRPLPHLPPTPLVLLRLDDAGVQLQPAAPPRRHGGAYLGAHGPRRVHIMVVQD